MKPAERDSRASGGMDRVTAIRSSLAAFVLGIIGVLPVIGLIPAALALGYWWAVQSNFRDQWNPASAYLRAGGALALFGILMSGLLTAVASIVLANHLLF